jgi:hypothetical protein
LNGFDEIKIPFVLGQETLKGFAVFQCVGSEKTGKRIQVLICIGTAIGLQK